MNWRDSTTKVAWFILYTLPTYVGGMNGFILMEKSFSSQMSIEYEPAVALNLSNFKYQNSAALSSTT